MVVSIACEQSEETTMEERRGQYRGRTLLLVYISEKRDFEERYLHCLRGLPTAALFEVWRLIVIRGVIFVERSHRKHAMRWQIGDISYEHLNQISSQPF